MLERSVDHAEIAPWSKYYSKFLQTPDNISEMSFSENSEKVTSKLFGDYCYIGLA